MTISISFESKSQFKTYIVQNITKFHHTHYADSQQHITSALKALPLQWSTAHHNYSLKFKPQKHAHCLEQNLKFSRFLAVNLYTDKNKLFMMLSLKL